jgi:hypothetical protein
VWLRSTERLDHVAYSTGETGPLWVPFGSHLSLSEPFGKPDYIATRMTPVVVMRYRKKYFLERGGDQ